VAISERLSRRDSAQFRAFLKTATQNKQESALEPSQDDPKSVLGHNSFTSAQKSLEIGPSQMSELISSQKKNSVGIQHVNSRNGG